jgi:HD-GYP domain-containing protein (c-di-GMP phosphodiesterase class II)
MNRIESKSLKAGIYFEAPVFLDDTYILLTPDTPVSAELIGNLKAWGLTDLITEGSPIGRGTPSQSAAATKKGATLDQNIKDREGLERARAFYDELITFSDKTFIRLKEDNILNISVITEEIKKAIAMVRNDEKYVLRFHDISQDNTFDYNVNHSARTIILALAIGEKLKMPNHKLIELGIATLLHEAGMLQIPSKIYQKEGALTEAEKKIINAHTVLGFRALKDFSLPRDVLLGVLEHHERNDGSGYPQGLDAGKISRFGKIIAVACSYDAQISQRPFRSGRDAHTSLTGMLKEMRSHYDEEIMKVLLTLLSIYPIGSYVVLENGYIGIVVETNSKDFRYPTVKVLLDSNKQPLQEQPVIKTEDEETMRITTVLNNKEIQAIREKIQNPNS